MLLSPLVLCQRINEIKSDSLQTDKGQKSELSGGGAGSC